MITLLVSLCRSQCKPHPLPTPGQGGDLLQTKCQILTNSPEPGEAVRLSKSSKVPTEYRPFRQRPVRQRMKSIRQRRMSVRQRLYASYFGSQRPKYFFIWLGSR